MARTPDPAIATRNAAIARYYTQNPTESYAEIAAEFNVSPALLGSILRAAGVTDRARRKPRGGVVPARAVDNQLVMIGSALDRRVRLMDDNKTEVAKAIGLGSGQRLTQIIRGHIDLSYSELNRIASFLGYRTAALLLDMAEAQVKQSLTGNFELDNMKR
jgi:hypothetical protein